MNRYLIGFLTVVILIVGVWMISARGDKVGLINPKVDTMVKVSPTPEPTNAPPNAPKTFQFDASTDLDAELDKVNPEVLDSDFE